MATARFLQLKRRLGELRKRFLPKRFSPVGEYSKSALDRTRGYRLLAHAEIEAFLEDRCRQKANSKLEKFRLDGKPTWVCLSLVSHHPRRDEVSGGKLKSIYDKKAGTQCLDVTKSATEHYNAAITENHGIREANILRLLLPIGIMPTDIDPTWLSTVDSFGAKRGEVAHTAVRTQQQIDPLTELRTVETILEGLAKIDTALGKN